MANTEPSASVDTNVLLRWLLQDVPEQARAVDHLFASGHRFVVEDAAIIEVVFVLERVTRLSRRTIAEAVRMLVATACLEMDRRLWTAIVSVYEEHPKLSVADAYLAGRAQERRATPLYTFDRKLASQMNDVLLVPSDPSEDTPTAHTAGQA
ncbi:MAG: PIN domain-containing protein [Pauljensenia sp.]